VAVAELSEAGLAQLREEERPIISDLRSDAILVGGSDLATVLEPA
jgi:hypothetical protein